MADLQSNLIVQDGKTYVSIDHLSTVLASLPDHPTQAIIASDLSPDGRLCMFLKLRPMKDAADQVTTTMRFRPNAIQNSGGTHGIHDGGYQDAPALLKQLKDIQLSDEDILNQLLTSSHPPALDELDKAKGSLVHLATAKDGRVFSVLVGSVAKSDWDIRYPKQGLWAPAHTRRMDDHMLHQGPITTYQFDELKDILRAAKDSEAGYWFRASVQVLWPELWERYHGLIERPMDLTLLEQNLDEDNYHTIEQFMRDVDLLRLNTVTLFGSSHMMTSFATQTVDMITREMEKRLKENPAMKKPATPKKKSSTRKERATSARTSIHEKAWPAKTVLSRGQICEIIYSSYMPSGQDASRISHYPRLVIPLGRVCVARSPNTEIYATKHIVVMDIATPRKALWLVWDHFSIMPDPGPYHWLPGDQSSLLDTNGRRITTLSRLADDINLWEVGSDDAGSDGLSGRGLGWDEIRVSDGAWRRRVNHSEVLLDLTCKRGILEAIQLGWGTDEQSKSREHRRDGQGSQADEPAAKRAKPNEARGAV
ncbi:hypothetical protein VMCG_10855 [Cytospora schulzeri]|uniref:Bromo domain-containing protein n=1 Tax=Cytospora schulzeri TaxID=448051 RepID=A0A423V895_9PEZI|nr:hypothetical protein VMCG_10855 [Valsa malicola]